MWKLFYSCCHLWSMKCSLGASVLIQKHSISWTWKTGQLARVRMVTTCCNECCPPTHQYIPRHTEEQTNYTLNCFRNGGLQESSCPVNWLCPFPQNRFSVTLLHSLPLWAEDGCPDLPVLLLPILWFSISASVSVIGIKSPIKVSFAMYGQVMLYGWAQGPPLSLAWIYPFSPGTSKNSSMI